MLPITPSLSQIRFSALFLSHLGIYVHSSVPYAYRAVSQSSEALDVYCTILDLLLFLLFSLERPEFICRSDPPLLTREGTPAPPASAEVGAWEAEGHPVPAIPSLSLHTGQTRGASFLNCPCK